jgi:CBS domain-containing protein
LSGVGFARGERTVKNLRLSKALTIPEGTTVSEACRRMAARRVDAVLLTDVNGLLSGIVTDKVIFLFRNIFIDAGAGCFFSSLMT